MFLGPAYSDGSRCRPGWGWNESWTLALMPNMEQTQVWNSYNFHVDGLIAINTTVGYNAISSLIVRPRTSRSGLMRPGRRSVTAAIMAARESLPIGRAPSWSSGTNYPGAWWGAAGDPNMAFFGIEGVTDGTSNTALDSEKLMGVNTTTGGTIVTSSNPYGLRGLYNVNYNGAYNTGLVANAVAGVAACKSIPNNTLDTGQQSLSGGFWHCGYPWAILINGYTHFNTPNGYSCITSSDSAGGSNIWGGTSGMITATSNHPGGVNFAFADGSVKFIKSSIGPQTWWAIGTRNQGEVVSSDSY